MLQRTALVPDDVAMRLLHLGIVFRLVPIVGGAWLGSELGAARGAAFVAAAGAVATLGALLVRTAPPGALTWRNVVAGWLLPWGDASAATSLVGIALTAFVAWALLGAAGAIAWRSPWLLAAWQLDAFVLVWLAGPVTRRGQGRSGNAVVTRLILFVALLAIAGLVAWFAGEPLLGAAIAGGPLAVSCLLYAVYVGLFFVLKPRF